MSSLLVFDRDNVHPNPAEQWQRFQRGDVIDIHADNGFNWGSDIAALGWWRVIVVDAPMEDLVHLTREEAMPVVAQTDDGREVQVESRGIRRLRFQRLDLSLLPAGTATLAEIQAATVDVPPVQDYYTFG